MAKSYFLTRQLKKNNPELFNNLNQTIAQPMGPDVLEKALETGTLDKTKYNPRGLSDPEFNIILNDLKKAGSSKDVYNKYIEETKDEANLTDEDLQGRLEAFQGISETNTKSTFNDSKLLERIKTVLTNDHKVNVNSTAGKAYVDNAVKYVKENNTTILTPLTPGLIPKIIAELNAGDFNDVTPDPVYKEDITRITDALTARGEKRTKDTTIDEYLRTGGQMETELGASRDDFMKGEEDRAFNELERQVPLTMQNLNVRGMLSSGEREDELSSKALNLESSLEGMKMELEAEDNQFYFDHAYKNALRKDLQSVSDYNSAITANRGNVLTERGQRFTSHQNKLNRDLNEQLTRNEYRRDLALRRKQAANEQRDRNKANRSAIASKIGGAIGGIAGGYFGGPGGAMAGYTAGSAVGSQVG